MPLLDPPKLPPPTTIVADHNIPAKVNRGTSSGLPIGAIIPRLPDHIDLDFAMQNAVSLRRWNQYFGTVYHQDLPKSPTSPNLEGARGDVALDYAMQAVVSRDLWVRFQKLAARTSDIAQEQRFWKAMGETGAKWLIERLSEPREMHELWQVGEILAAMSEQFPLILKSLASQESAQTTQVLLSIVGSIGSQFTNLSTQVSSILAQYLSHPDDAVRSQAAASVSGIDDHSALSLLRGALCVEKDQDVRLAIEAEIELRSHN